VNEGVLVANGTDSIIGSFSNAAGATVRAQPDGSTGFATLVLPAFTNSGLVELTSTVGSYSSTLTVTGGPLVNAAGATLAILPGTGGARTVTGTVDNQGTLDLFRGSTGTLQVNGALATSGTLGLDLGGTALFGRINATSGFTLGGALTVGTYGGFTPATGNSFTILTTTATVGGTFASATLPWAGTPTYNPSSVVLTVP
jgi:hypothetical protein